MKNSPKKKRFLSLSLFLLLQGQFVSVMGDMIYEIALGFWVLALTGSPALMGILMATSLVPGIVLSPFAGVMVDRTNRKKLMIIMDLIRGIQYYCGIGSFNGFFVDLDGVRGRNHSRNLWRIFWPRCDFSIA